MNKSFKKRMLKRMLTLIPAYFEFSIKIIYRNLFKKRYFQMKADEFLTYHSVENIDVVFKRALIDYCSKLKGKKLKVLDIGGGTGSGWKSLIESLNDEQLGVKFELWILDLEIKDEQNKNRYIIADICLDDLSITEKEFDIIFSQNAYEHFPNPISATKNSVQMLKDGGLALIRTVFACHHHPVPGDYFRFTDSGLEYLFSGLNKMQTIECGYDVSDRRSNKLGKGPTTVLTDHLGGWLERWYVYYVGIKDSL
jgi:SAM-dependent methyltransferase